MNKIKYVLSILAVLALVSCAKDEPTRLTDVTGLIPDLDFTLIDENNKTATANDFLGYSVALFLALLIVLKYAQRQCISYLLY